MPGKPAIPGGSATVMYRVAGRTYPMKVVNGCKVCNSPWRVAAENYVIMGNSYKATAENLPDDCDLTEDNLRHHFNCRHLPLEEQARQELLRRRAQELNWDQEAAADVLSDHILFLRSGVQDVMTRMRRREIQPDIKDGIAMSRALAAIDIDQDTEHDLAMYVQAIKLVMEAARRNMTPEQFARFSMEVLNDPIIEALRDPAAAVTAKRELMTGEAS